MYEATRYVHSTQSIFADMCYVYGVSVYPIETTINDG